MRVSAFISGTGYHIYLFRHARVLYLHGFASSPRSRKARFFAEKFSTEGVLMEALDLEQGNFAGLTLTSQLKIVEAAARKEEVVLIGSSLGGYLAALYAARHTEVQRLVLLAPAFRFRQLWENEVGLARMEEWRKKGVMPVFHYGEAQLNHGPPSQRDLGYGIMDDASQYEVYPCVTQPCLIFHGWRDAVVPVAGSEEFERMRSNVRVVHLQSGHELTDVLDEIWEESKPFLGSQT